MSKKISEMNVDEKFIEFKNLLIEMVKNVFNGPISVLDQELFLAVKPELIINIMKNHKDSMTVENVLNEKIENVDEIDKNKIHVIPLGLSGEIRKIVSFLGDDEKTISFAKELSSKIMKNRIDHLEEKHPFGIQFLAHVSEAYILEKKISSKEKYKYDMGEKTEELKSIEKELNEKGSIKNIDGVCEKVIIMLETREKSQLITFDILRSEDGEYQEIVNKEEYQATNTPSSGVFSGFLHKQNLTN